MKTRLRRFAPHLLFTGLALATLLGLFYAEEDWRGAHQRASAERELIARGEPMQVKDLLPPLVPDRQNLAMAPIFAGAFNYRFDHRTGLVTFGPPGDTLHNPTRFELDNVFYGPGNQSGATSPHPSANWSAGHRRNLAAWQDYYRHRRDFPHAPEPQTPAADILLAQSRYVWIFDDLTHAAAERPLTRFPVNWLQRPSAGIGLAHYNTLLTLVSALSLRASCHLASNQPAEARRDLELAFRLTAAIRNDPILIPHLVQASCLGILTQPLWEGLEARRWSADDMEVFGGLLRDFDALRSYQQGLRGERTLFVNQTIDDLRTPAGRNEIFREAEQYDSSSNHLRLLAWISRLCPQGWFDLNIALGDRLLQRGIDAVDPVQGRVFLDRQQSYNQSSDVIPLRSATFAIQYFLPVYQSQLVKAAQTQAGLNQAVAACALERYFLDHQAYPAALTELVPRYLGRVPG